MGPWLGPHLLPIRKLSPWLLFLPPSDATEDKSREVQPQLRVVQARQSSEQKGRCGVKMRGPEAGKKPTHRGMKCHRDGTDSLFTDLAAPEGAAVLSSF